VTIFGWDASHYDAVPDGARVVSEGIKFMTHKAGGDANDAELASWWKEMKPYRDRVLLGAYWVLYPGNPSGRADSFLARLDSQCPGWRDGPFILQADCEIWGGDKSTLPSVAEANAFGDRLAAKAPKLRMIGYMPKWCYGSGLGSFRYPIWSSRYVSGSGTASGLYPGDSSSLWGAYSGGAAPAVLQFSSSANIAGQTTCDANAYRGTLDQLTALLAPGWKEEEMALESDDVRKVWGYDPGLTNGDPWPGVSDETFPPGGNGTVAPGTALTYLLKRQRDNHAAVMAALAQPVQIDVTALAAALVAALPAGSTEGLSLADVQAAAEAGMRAVLRNGVGTA